MLYLFSGTVEVEGVELESNENFFITEGVEAQTIENGAEVPLGYEEDNCVVHSLMLFLTIAFVIYNLYRVVVRAKANKAMTEIDASADQI